MIAAAAFCPQAPALVPAVAPGTEPELDDLRTACRAALARVVTPGRPVVMLAPAPGWRSHGADARGTFAGLGVPLEVGLGDRSGGIELPLGLSVAAWLVQDAVGPGVAGRAFSVGQEMDGGAVERSLHECLHGPDDVALLVMGDGSARRSTTAPGYLSERAAPIDGIIAAALASGDGSRLHGLYGEYEDLLISGISAWEAVAPEIAGREWDAELLYDAAPLGVGYFVATWTARA